MDAHADIKGVTKAAEACLNGSRATFTYLLGRPMVLIPFYVKETIQIQ